jgi:plastocyanin
MLFRPLVALAATLLLVAACSSGGGATTAPSAAPAEPSAAASEAPASEAPAAAACEKSAAGGEVDVSIEGFAFNPADITATVGQTITFTNGDSAPHTATLDDGSCTTPNIANGASEGLTFNAAGTYPFHCTVHPDMKGTITIS